MIEDQKETFLESLDRTPTHSEWHFVLSGFLICLLVVIFIVVVLLDSGFLRIGT